MSRNGFNECEREYNRREEAVEMAREERTDRQEPSGLRYKATVLWDDKTTVHEGVYKGASMSDTPRTDAVCKCAIGQQLERELISEAERVEMLEEALRNLLIAEKLDDDCLLLQQAREKARQALQEKTADKLERLANTQWWDGLEQQMYEAAMDAVRELRALKRG